MSETTTSYIYDVEDRETYGSCSNRLMAYQIDDPSTGDLEDVYYYYDVRGNVKRIVRYTDGDPQYRSTRFVYNTAGMVEYLIGETWNAADPVDWQLNDANTEYGLTPTEMTWEEARTYAQSRDEFPFLHVGHRWYDPETGRFLQRDPAWHWRTTGGSATRS